MEFNFYDMSSYGTFPCWHSNTPWQLTDKPYHNRFMSALRDRLGQPRDVHLDSQAPRGSVQTQYQPQGTSVSDKRADSFNLFSLNSYIC